ncbi:MAG: NUDIX hydrolase [bacterium]
MQKKSVGLQLLSKNTNGELVAILQVRAKWNAEKNAPETFPGACQVTVHGKLEEGEDFIEALLREVAEELGKEIVPHVQKLIDTQNLKELITNQTPEKHVITYGALVGTDILNILINREVNDSFGGFKIITQKEIAQIVDMKTIDKIEGVTDQKTIAMFPDEKQAVSRAFELLFLITTPYFLSK